VKTVVNLLNSFGKTEDGGNPAGVVLDAENISDEQRKEISKIVGYSETAFVEKSDKADFKVRFFTPTEEVDLCGHATIATYSLLLSKHLIKIGTYSQELKAGVLAVEILEDGTVLMAQSLPAFSDTFKIDEILDIFKCSEDVFTVNNLPIQIVSTGLRDVFVPVKDRVILDRLAPDFSKMAEFNKKTNTIGFHLFTLDTLYKEDAGYCRNFAPLYGIDEESATGSSNGALACYLYEYGIINHTNNVVFEQGYRMNKLSEIVAKLEILNKKITTVKIGGKATLIGEKNIDL